MDTNDIVDRLEGLGVPPADAQILAAVAMGESGYNPIAELHTADEDSVGLFQINMFAHGDKLTGFTGSQDMAAWRTWLQDPLNNIQAAAAVYFSQGLGAWTQFTKGGYLQHLNKTYEVQGVPGEIQGPPGDPNVNWRPAEVPEDAPGPYEPKWKQLLYYNKLWIKGLTDKKWADIAQKYIDAVRPSTALPGGGRPSILPSADIFKWDWVQGKVGQFFILVAGLALGVVGIVLMAKESVVKLVKEGP